MNSYSYPGIVISFDEVIKEVLTLFNVTQKKIEGRSRKRIYTMPRQLLMALEVAYNLREYNSANYSDVARRWNRHHATVIHSVKAVNNDFQVDENYRTKVYPIFEKYRFLNSFLK